MKMQQALAFRRTALVLLAVFLLGIVIVQVARPAQAQATNLALNKPTTCSPTPQFPCAEAVDGNMGTRWASAQGVDPQWIQVDLGATTTISQVVLYWEAAYARSYQIQVSASASGPWTNIYSTTTGDGGTDTLSVSGSGRYVRMNGTVRATGYGYSLWEFQIYGGGTPPPTTPPPTTPPPTTPPPTTPPPTTPPPSGNLALNRPVTCSSIEAAGYPCAAAVDGNTGTRWASAYSDPQWIYVDLGATYSINRVVLIWEAAYGRSYQIQVSASASGPWTNIYSTTTGNGATDDLTGLSGSGRYVRMYGTVRATGYGYSLFEFQVYSGGTPPPTTPPPTTPPPTTPPPTTPPPTTPPPTTPPPSGNLALNRPVTCSSVENAGTPCAAAVDGNTGTRWASVFSDPQWIYVDLGATYSITRVVLLWEAAYGRSYQIQVSASASGPWTNVYSTTTGDGGTDDLAVTGSGRYVRMNGTVRATAWGYSLWELQVYSGGTPPPTTPPPTTPPPTDTTFWGDTTSIPPANNVLMFKFLNRTNGRYPDNQVYWSFNGQVHTIAEAPYFDMPANSAGRMYFGLGAAPNAANPNAYWDFIEFTIGPTVFNGNTTRVDAFGLKLAMRLHADDGFDVAVGENQATFAEDRAVTFQRFKDTVPAEFDHLADLRAPYRIVEPGAGEFRPGGLYANYYNSYVDQMWANNGLTVPKPGPNAEGLGAYPDLSAAIFRHVGASAGTFSPSGQLLSQALWANPSTFYTAAPANYYAKFMHDIAINGLAYGFPYDDVGGYSSFISHGNPTWLIVAIGW